MKASWFKYLAISLMGIWLLLLALLPFILAVGASLLHPGQPGLLQRPVTLANYSQLVTPVFFHVFLRSFQVAAITTFFCLLLGYPFAYILAKLPERLRLISLFFIIIPFWTSSLIRSYAILTIIKTHGLLNYVLLKLGIIQQPLHLLYTQFASQIGLIYALLPFMILPLYATLEKFDWRLVEAARDLGATPAQAFWRVVVPMSMPGIFAGVLLTLLPAMTLFYIPEILGGAKSMLLGNLIKDQFLLMNNWPSGAAISLVLTVLMALLVVIYWYFIRNKKQQVVV